MTQASRAALEKHFSANAMLCTAAAKEHKDVCDAGYSLGMHG